MTDTVAPDVNDEAADLGEIRLGRFRLTWDDRRPLSVHSDDAPIAGRRGVALVELFTADEQRERTSQAYYRSAVGSRLRVRQVRRSDDGSVERAVVEQRDGLTGIETSTTLSAPHDAAALRVETTVVNGSDVPVVLTTVSTATVGFGRDEASVRRLRLLAAESEWLAENRWRESALGDLLPELSLPLHGQDGRGHASLTSHGAWSSGERLPVGAIVDGDEALAWQIETSAGWHVDLCQTAVGGVLSLLGPTDLENHFAHRLAPGAAFSAVPGAIAVSKEGRDGAFAELTRYRRWLRRERTDRSLPVIYNDFLNTLMGQPTTEALLPLIQEAASAGAEVFCIDAGWFASPAIGDWWSTVGEWKEAEDRFPDGGLKRLTDEIRARGMRVGLWLEPEVVGVDSPVASTLPDDAFFHRFGRRVREHERFHLDFRHPAARAHVDEAIDALVREHAVSYLKLDYNINPGAGTEANATAAGDGLLGHTRAYRDWLEAVQERHRGLLIENCSSGAMRADYALLAATHIQSTSDQQDFLLYPPVAASAPASILPEQSGNWACPAAGLSNEETAFTLVTGMSGRLYLSGFLDRLSESQRRAVAEAVALHKDLRYDLASTEPFWPLGLPRWDDDHICVGLRSASRTLLFVWDRAEPASEILIPGVRGEAVELYPTSGWELEEAVEGLHVRTLAGPTARVIAVAREAARS